MKSKYIDAAACCQVIGNIYNNPNLLEATDKYFFNEEDFSNEFQRIVFGTIYNLFQLGATSITLESIEDYLTQRPQALAVYKTNSGSQFLVEAAAAASLSTFDYYYNRMKKMTLLREYQTMTGMDLNWLYDPDNIFDDKKKEQQENWLDNTSLSDIANIIEDKVSSIRMKYVDDDNNSGCDVGDGIDELLESFKETPELGYPLFGKYVNTITRGARLKKFYLRSAGTGIGKTRSMVADACYIGCYQMYDTNEKKWISTGASQPTVYIATEQPLDEIQTMCIAFLSGVNEEHIVTGMYDEGEWDRAAKAAQLLKQSKITFEYLPDFSLQDVENAIKRGIRERDAKYIFLDYMHTSMKILEEITKRSGGVRLREDNILFMMSIRLKDLCNQYGIFIMSATQLNGDYREAKEFDQNLLRGAKSIADKIDLGMIMLGVTQEEKEALAPIVAQLGCEMPDTKVSVYKNRRGRWKDILMWCVTDKGSCRVMTPVFITDYSYTVQDIVDYKIKIEDESAF